MSGFTDADIVPSTRSGGANTSHTIAVHALTALLRVVPSHADKSEYERAVVERNVLNKRTEDGRRRTLRYLKELYLLRPDSIVFRALRDLWPDDPDARPLLAGVCALARDAVFRASGRAVVKRAPGELLTNTDLADAVSEQFPGNYGQRTLAKIGRNTFSSWEQTGHLQPSGPGTKLRVRATCRPVNVAYALMLGHLEGKRGQGLFDTPWMKVLDQPKSHLTDLATAASQRGLLEFRHAGGVIDVGFRELLRPFEEPPR